ncbi:MAG: U32 family peptidase [Thermodesulfobacteriota bacterium]
MQVAETGNRPLILAPAGGKDSFLAALAAGADAVYCGLKMFSARMAAENFTVAELARLTSLAHARGVKVYVAFNTLLKQGEADAAAGLLEQVHRHVRPDALIIQDLAFIRLSRLAGFSGELHLSTLANVSFPAALELVAGLRDIQRVVVPRELSVDEIKAMAAVCPENLSLEVFVHGALCYGVSGRCYWSSYLGGRSGLRGRCVQPCRRMYRSGADTKRFFSCQDLSLDVLAKVLLPEEKISAWKIEGRKKGPHYVYSTVNAYRLFRDHAHDPAAKKEALGLLANALGRTGTHYHFLSQRPQPPVRTDIQTGSGRLIGNIMGAAKQPFLRPNLELMTGDILRFGYEDEAGHQTQRVKRPIPKRGRLVLGAASGSSPRPGAPVFLIDRREKVLAVQLAELETELERLPVPVVAPPTVTARHARRSGYGKKKRARDIREMTVYRRPVRSRADGETGFWLSEETESPGSKKEAERHWWWLPPVIWPARESAVTDRIGRLRQLGGRRFVLNAPWQMALFSGDPSVVLWAGPFCNITNIPAVEQLAGMGFHGVIVSPELGATDYEHLVSACPLPLGIVVSGHWPLCVSRTISTEFQVEKPFTSPKGEQGWVKAYDGDFWVYPNWRLDIRGQQDILIKLGFQVFVHLSEPVPGEVELKTRQGLWNWEIELQ